MHEKPFDESKEPELHSSERLRRQEESIEYEAEEAADVGSAYDELGAILEDLTANLPKDRAVELLESGTDKLAMNLRYIVAERDDVLDPGSLDGELIKALGEEVATSPDVIEVIIEKAKERRRRTGEQGEIRVKVEEFIPAWQEIELESVEREQTRLAAGYAMEHAVDPEDIRDLMQNDPRDIRNFARMLKSPAAARLERDLSEAMTEGKMFTYQEIKARLVGILARHNKEMAKLDAGDPEALRRQMLNPRVHEVLGDAFSTQIPDAPPLEETDGQDESGYSEER